jgi:hypothetical protein
MKNGEIPQIAGRYLTTGQRGVKERLYQNGKDISPQISYGGVGTNITANFCGRFIDSPPLFPL